ncbi:MAG: tetratricopeptide repeat protein [Actinomycetota bacterium]|nr:tetratricopeptide repeat protein [Actinomycetota bacterium]
MDQLSGFRVFIASPGGLDEERRAFRRTLLEINEDDAFERGIVLIPTGWELTLGGVGRPQDKINADIRRCDYLVLMLWDRWGTPPSDTSEFSSGTEEEYAVAMNALRGPDLPMRDVVVMFKGVNARQLSDPGSELSKVLAFKQQLEADKDVLYTTFDSVDEFKRHIDRHVRRWLRDEEPNGPAADALPSDDPRGDQDGAGSAEAVPQIERGGGESESAPTEAQPDGVELEEPVPDRDTEAQAEEDVSTLLADADTLAKEGRLSEAEELYARAVVGRTDRDALAAYARFLRRTGRFDRAADISLILLKESRREGDVKAQIEAISNIAIIHRKQGRLAKATGEIAQAIDLAEGMGDAGLDDLAFLRDNEGHNARKRGDFRQALAEYEKALEIRQRNGDKKRTAQSYNNISPLLRQLGEVDTALEMQETALTTFEQSGYARGLAPGYANRGEIYELLGKLDEAREDYARSLEHNRRLGSPEGIGMNYMELGRLALKTQQTPVAREYAERALAGEDSANRPEGMATATQLLGLVLAEEGDLAGAMERLKKAAEINGGCDHIVGLVYTLCDLADVEVRAGLRTNAQATVERASRTMIGVEHVQLSERLESLVVAVKATNPA